MLIGLGFTAFELLWYSEPISFWVRPDALTILATSLGLLSLFLRGRILPLITLSVGIVLAFDSKLDSIVFLLPPVAVLVSRNGLKFFAWLAAVSIPLSFVPFLIPNVTLHGFSIWAFSMVGSATRLDQALKNLFFFAMLVLPVALFCPRDMFWANREMTEDGIILLSALVAGVLVMYPAAKIGSGTHHYAPLSVWIGYLLARCASRREAPEPGHQRQAWSIVWLSGFAVWAVLTVLIFVRSAHPILDFLQDKEPGLAQEDLLRPVHRYPAGQVQMGYGSPSTYRDSFLRPWIYQSGMPDVVDAPACMNMQVMGLTQEAFKRCLAQEQYRYWILPKGTPFSLSFYMDEPLFEAKVGPLFADHYERIESSSFYDVYESRQATRAPSEPVK